MKELFWAQKSKTAPERTAQMADYFNAVKGLQENLAVLNENGTQEQIALWNVSNALLTVCDALRELEVKVDQIQYQTKSRQ